MGLMALNGVTTTGASSAINSPKVGLQPAKGFAVHVYSASTSAATVKLEGSYNGEKWYPLVTLTNPDSDGFMYRGTATRYFRVNVSARSSGTLYALIDVLEDDPGPWAPITAATNTAGALSCTSLTNSGLTTGRVPYSTTGGLQTDEAAFAYDASTNTLSADVFKGAEQPTIAAKATDGAIASAPGVIVITKGSALGSSTLATPTVTTHDGYILRITSSTAYAHVISCASGKVNGGTITTLTFGAAIGNSITLVAYQGVWYTVGNTNVTLS